MPLFKLASVLAREKRVTVFAVDLHDCVRKGVQALALPEAEYDAYDDSDGSLIMDDSALLALANCTASKLFVTLVPRGQTWSGAADPAAVAVQQATPSASLVTPVSVSRPVLPGLRQHVSVLETALASPLALRAAALVRAKRTVIKRLVEVLKPQPQSPGDMRYMCEQLRKACPGAFLVNIREDAAGTSFFPFVKSLYNALNYSKCTESGTPRRRRNNRRRLAVDDADPDDPEAMVPLLCVDSNGCADGMWGPAFSADEELEMEATRQALKAIYLEEQEGSEVNMVKDSYALQRSHFNQAKTKTDWLRAFSNWPILQRTPAFLAHSNLLMGKSCQDVWADGLLNPKLFLNFMANYCAVLERNPTASGRWAFMTDHLQKSSDAALDEGNRPLKIAVFPLLLTYFQEKVHHFFLTVDANATLQEIRERVTEESNCPLLVVKGLSIYDATATFTVIVRGQFAIQAETFVQGALIVLLSYFVFNIQYPKAIFRTLEFLQRYFLRVNPVCQSRKEGKEKTKLNSAVATLSNKLLSFEASQSRWNA